MTETQLYRKVYCKDRLPGKNDHYIFFDGNDFPCIDFFNENDLEEAYTVRYKYWIEPVKLPIDEEIEGMAEKYSFVVPFDGSDKFYDGIKNKSFIEGFKKCLELLKGGEK